MADESYQCPQCDREPFKTKGALTQHVKREHGDDPAAALRAKFGGIAPRPGGATESGTLRAAPSGIPAVDYAIGIGGLPRGRIAEVFGPPKAGKTFQALTFTSHAQRQGEKCGFVDAERALESTFLELIPGLDVPALEYAPEDRSKEFWGDQALEMTKEFMKLGIYGIWTVDSVKALVPESAKDIPIGSSKAQAQLARLLSDAIPVIDQIVASTNTTLVFINHQKEKPGVTHGRNWYVPGGSALEYHSAVRLHVTAGRSLYDTKQRRVFGHVVRVRVEKSKVAAPHSEAEYILCYHPGTDNGKGGTNRDYTPGIDIPSGWLSICKEENLVVDGGPKTGYIDLVTGEKLGPERDVLEMLNGDGTSELLERVRAIVYPEEFR